MKHFWGLLISSTLVLCVTLFVLSDTETLASLKPYIRFIWIAVTPIFPFCLMTINTLTAMIDNDELRAKENIFLVKKLKVQISKLWGLLIFYIFTSLYVLFVTLIPMKSIELSLWLTSMGVILTYMSLFSGFKIKFFHDNMLTLKADLNYRKAKKREIEEAHKRLNESSERSEADKAYYKAHNQFVALK